MQVLRCWWYWWSCRWFFYTLHFSF